MTKKKFNFWGTLNGVLSSSYFKSAFRDLLIKVLKLQAFGGIRGWIVNFVVTYFSDEVIERVGNVLDYVEIKVKTDETIEMENRDEATDLLNDIMR